MTHRPFACFCVCISITPLLGVGSAAQAMPTVDLFFVERNGAAIAPVTQLSVDPGDELRVEMRMTTDARGVAGFSISVDFDSAGDGRIALDDFANVPVPALPLVLGLDTPFGPNHPNGTPGFIEHFTAATLAPSPASENTVLTIAEMTFTVSDAIAFGPAVIVPGLFVDGVDEVLSNELELIGSAFEFRDISADVGFGAARLFLHTVPEPASSVLVVLGLLALAGTRPTRRSS